MVNYLNYNIGKTFSLLLNQFKMNSFLSILISCILYGIILYLNKEKKITKYVFVSLNIILIFLILYLYFGGIISFKYRHPFKNIYVYFLNSIIYLLLIIILNKKMFNSIIRLTIYTFILIGILYSIYFTIYLQNVNIVVIGNIFPEIFFGNILILINYVYILANKIIESRK